VELEAVMVAVVPEEAQVVEHSEADEIAYVLVVPQNQQSNRGLGHDLFRIVFIVALACL
jgi:hypothetical protein